MEENRIFNMSETEFHESLENLKKSNQAQADYAKKAYVMSLVSGIAIIILVIAVGACFLILMPKIISLLNQAQTSLQNINSITTEIAKVDFEGLIGDVGSLVTTTEKDLGVAMTQIEKIDIEGLNSAISDLSGVVQPLAKLFGR